MGTGALALLIATVILSQIIIVMLIGFYRRKRKYIELEDTSSASEKISNSKLVWDGFKEFIVQRRVMEDHNKAVCSFYLVPKDGKPLPDFKPGQYLTFKLEVENPYSHEQKSIVRCYSLSDVCRPDYYRVSIKRISATATQPDALPGLSSNFFHDDVTQGSELLVKAPRGHFHLMDDSLPPHCVDWWGYWYHANAKHTQYGIG